MSEPLTPEQIREQIIAELKAQPGPQPMKPIPPEVMAEILADQTPYEEAVRDYQDLIASGGSPIEPYLDELKGKYLASK